MNKKYIFKLKEKCSIFIEKVKKVNFINISKIKKEIKFNKFKEIKLNKKYFLVISIIVMLIVLIKLNDIKAEYYGITKNNSKLMELLSESFKNDKTQEKPYVKRAIRYLITNNEKDSINFLDNNFNNFIKENKILIVKIMNEKKFSFEKSGFIFKEYISDENIPEYKEYIKNLDVEKFNKDIIEKFNKTSDFNEENINYIFDILLLRDNLKEIKGFQVDLISLLNFTYKDKNFKSKANKIIEVVDKNISHEFIFNKLKEYEGDLNNITYIFKSLEEKEILNKNEVENFNSDIGKISEILKQISIIDNENKHYSNEILGKEKDINVMSQTIYDIQDNIKNVEKEYSEDKQRLKDLDSGFNANIYIVGKLNGGSNNEYEGALPEWNDLIKQYIPTNQRVIYKGNKTLPTSRGVIDVKVYSRGFKKVKLKEEFGSFEQDWEYFEEVPDSAQNEIDNIKNKISKEESILNKEKGRIPIIEEQINIVKNSPDYKKNNELININNKNRQDKINNINDIIQKIKKDYSIKDIKVDIEKIKPVLDEKTTDDKYKKDLSIEDVKENIKKYDNTLVPEELTVTQIDKWGEKDDVYEPKNDNLKGKKCYSVFQYRTFMYVIDGESGEIYSVKCIEFHQKYDLERTKYKIMNGTLEQIN